MVLDRYILRQWATSFFGLLFIVTGVLLLGRVLKLLGVFSEKGLDWGIMATMLMAIIPYFLVITVPISFFFAMQAMFLRLYQNSEMDALRASGLSYLRLLRPLFVVSILLWGLLTITALYWMPEGQKSFQSLLIAVQKAKPAPGFDPQRFNHDLEDFTVYVEGKDEKGELHGFMLEDRRSDVPVVYMAERAEIKKEGAYLNFILFDGTRLEGSMASLRTLSFDQYQVSLGLGEIGLLKIPVWQARVFEMNLDELWQAVVKYKRHNAVAELNRRILLPTTVIILMLLALPISITQKRSGRAGSYIVGVALMLLIYNSQIALHQQVAAGNFPWWSMWLGQAAFFSFAIWAFYRASQDRFLSPVLFFETAISMLQYKVLLMIRRRSDLKAGSE